MVTNRNNVLDVLSGIFILRMVYTHTCMYAALDDHTVLFDITGMFLMWFFFKGGMLVKETKKYPEILVSSRKKLLKPFICLAIIMADFVKFYCLDIPKNYCVIYYLTIVLVVSVVLHKYLKQTKLKFLIGL